MSCCISYIMLGRELLMRVQDVAFLLFQVRFSTTYLKNYGKVIVTEQPHVLGLWLG